MKFRKKTDQNLPIVHNKIEFIWTLNELHKNFIRTSQELHKNFI